jgi:hypothetical protein
MSPRCIAAILPLLAVALAAFTGLRLQRTLRAAESEIARLEANPAPETPTSTPESPATRGPSTPIDPFELHRLRESKIELLRLRGQIADLRQAVASAGRDPATETAELQARTDAARVEADQLRRGLEFDKASSAASKGAQFAMNLATWAAQSRNGQAPASWVDVESLIRNLPRPGPDPVSEGMAGLWTHVQESGVHLDDFEIVPGLRRSGPSRRGVTSAPLIVRERTPREVPPPQGGWARFYGFPDGGIEEVVSPDGSFQAWEQQNLQPAATAVERSSPGSPP